jgi:hypothetical protein
MKHFRTNRALTLAEIQKFAPAALAEKASDSVSKNYSFLSTKKVIDTLEKKNIIPYSVTQTSGRSEDAKETAKHMIRFRQKNFKVSLGELIPEIILETSHDAKSAFRFTRNERKAPTSKVGDISELKRPQHQTVQGLIESLTRHAKRR